MIPITYFSARKIAIRKYNFKLKGESIQRVVVQLLKDNRSHTVEFFIKECQFTHNQLLEKTLTDNQYLSQEKRTQLINLIITDLHDCKTFGKMLISIYDELELKPKFFMLPLLNNKFNILEGMTFILSILLLFNLFLWFR